MVRPDPAAEVVAADGEIPKFRPGDQVRIGNRSPIGHYRVPLYVRGKVAMVQAIVEPPALDNEREGFGLNAGSKRHFYRVEIPMKELWADYRGSPCDGMRIEIFETWLEEVL
jgi:nitrile hydratase